MVPEAISHYWSMWLYVRSVSGWPLAAGGPGGARTGSGVASLTTARLCQQAIVRAENMAFPCRHFYLQGRRVYLGDGVVVIRLPIPEQGDFGPDLVQQTAIEIEVDTA